MVYHVLEVEVDGVEPDLSYAVGNLYCECRLADVWVAKQAHALVLIPEVAPKGA